MASYPFSKVPPPNVLPAVFVGPEEGDAVDEPTRPDELHIGRMTAFFVIALTSVTMLAVGALWTLDRDSGAGVSVAASAPVVTDDETSTPPSTGRLLVDEAEVGSTSNLLFAPIADPSEQIDERERTWSIDDRRAAITTTETASEPDAVLFVSESGTRQISISSDWDAPILRSTEDTQLHIFNVHSYSTTVITWDVSDGASSPQAVIETEAEIAGMTTASIETISGSDGEEVLVGTLMSEDTQTRALLAVHQADTGYAAAFLTSPTDRYEEASAKYREHIESVRFTG